MVDFKFLLYPPVNSVLIRRQCRRVNNLICKETEDVSSDIQTKLQAGYYLIKIKKQYIFIAVGIIIAFFLAAFLSGAFSKTPENKLIPPNPRKRLPPSASVLHTFTKAAVCADGAPCAEIGRNIFKRGGSAIDATVAAMFCNGIFTMQSMGLGGGFLMTIYKRDEKKVYTLNARETAPMKATQELYAKDRLISQRGPLAIGVPGELMGYWEAHQRFGKLKWEELMQPTIDLCESGYVMTVHQHTSLTENDITHDENLMEWFGDQSGKYKKAGSRIKPKKLCNALRIIAERGALDFYNGTLADMIVEDITEMGGIITKEDLANYSVQWSDPINIKLQGGSNLYSVPPPGAGILLGYILNILNGYNFTRESITGLENTILTYHRTIEAFKYAYAKRTELGDTSYINITTLLSNLTSPEFAEQTRLKIKDNETSQDPEHYGAKFYTSEDHGTAHISVIAENGDAVSVTSSVNIYFGSGRTSNQTGIILNSVMDDFSFPHFKNFFGLPGSPNNAMVPGKRPLSSMSPAIIIDKNDDVKLVVGASGGTKITTAVALVIMRALWFQQNIKEAVDAPRIHHQLYPMEVPYEYGNLEAEIEGLDRIGHKTTRSKASSIICALFKTANQIIANADFRKGGDVYGIN